MTKKLTLIALAIFNMSFVLNAQDWGTPGRKPESFIWLAGHLEAGWNPYIGTWDWSDYFLKDNNDNMEEKNAFYVDLSFTVHLSSYVFVGGYSKTWMLINEDSTAGLIPNFIPFLIDYGFFFGLRYKNFEVGLRHFCSHPIVSGSSFEEPMMENNRSYEEIYVRFEF
jgi:hypothetical protein